MEIWKIAGSPEEIIEFLSKEKTAEEKADVDFTSLSGLWKDFIHNGAETTKLNNVAEIQEEFKEMVRSLIKQNSTLASAELTKELRESVKYITEFAGK